jgi:hypothetical protein
MQIKPPQIDEPLTPQAERRLINRTSMLLVFALILTLTVVAWLLLWGGGIKEAAEADSAAAAAEASR